MNTIIKYIIRFTIIIFYVKETQTVTNKSLLSSNDQLFKGTVFSCLNSLNLDLSIKFLAVKNGDLKSTKEAVKNGADVNGLDSSNSNSTPLIDCNYLILYL